MGPWISSQVQGVNETMDLTPQHTQVQGVNGIMDLPPNRHKYRYKWDHRFDHKQTQVQGVNGTMDLTPQQTQVQGVNGTMDLIPQQTHTTCISHNRHNKYRV